MNEHQLKQVELKLYKKRWFVLALLICLMIQMMFTYTNFGFLNNILVLLFNTTYAAIDWLYLSWNIGTTVVALGTSWLAVKGILTCRRSMIVASILQVTNCLFIIIAFLQPRLFFLFIIGQVIGGISAAVLWSVPTSVAQLWFPESQIGIATGMSMIGSSSGGIIAYLLPAHIMKYPNNKSMNSSNVTINNSWMEYDKKAYQWLFLALLMASLAVLLFLLTVVPEQPEIPPSLAQHFKRVEKDKNKVTFSYFVSEIKKLIFEKAFLACGLATCMLYYFLIIIDLTIELMIAHMPLVDFISSESLSAYTLSVLTIGCWVGNIAGGAILDKYKNYRLQSSIGSTFGTLFAMLVLLSVYFQNLIGLFFSMFFEGFFTRIAYLSIIDSLMQHTYPTDPIFVMPFLIFCQNIMATLFIEIGRQITYHGGVFGGLGVLCAMMFLVALTSIVFKPNTKRLSAENKIERNEAESRTPLLLDCNLKK